MPRVPQFERETRYNATPIPYQHYETNENTFGASIANATQNLGNAMQNFATSAQKIQDNIDDAKMLELSNKIEEWQQNNLYDKQNGYYNKLGKDAASKSQEILNSYDKFVTDYLDKNKISGLNKKRLDYMLAQKKDRIAKGVTSHDIDQTKVWAQAEGNIGIDNAIKGMVQGRNNPDEIRTNLNSALKIIEWQGLAMNLDETSVNTLKKDTISKGYSSILDTLISEHNLAAKAFFDEHKNDINSNLHSRYIEQIKNEEDKYIARNTANSIIYDAKSEAEAIRKAEQIEDINMSDQVVNRIKRHYSEEEQAKNEAEKNALNNFYNTVIQKTQTGEQISYDDIPDNLDPQIKLSLMNYVNKNGQPDTDETIWESLYQKSVNDAQGFAKEDLNKYRGYLSDGEYKSFVKKQNDIKSGNYYTTIKDDDKKINAALKVIGLDKNSTIPGKGHNRDIAYSEIKTMAREYEARKGRSINDEELQNIINSLGYKDKDGVQIYRQIEKGMREKTGFIRDVVNDFAYYQSQHDGKLPSDPEKLKIINYRVNSKTQEKKTQAQITIDSYKQNAMTMRNISYTVAKPNEQKVLTYFADNQLPTLGKQLGIKLTVTSRYRNQEGSHHKEGRAADVSMSEHNTNNRIRIYEKLLALPTVYKIGTSDPNILAHFKGNSKIVDETKYDKQHGTNHVNHAHVTLINVGNASNNKVASNNNVYKF